MTHTMAKNTAMACVWNGHALLVIDVQPPSSTNLCHGRMSASSRNLSITVAELPTRSRRQFFDLLLHFLPHSFCFSPSRVILIAHDRQTS